MLYSGFGAFGLPRLLRSKARLCSGFRVWMFNRKGPSTLIAYILALKYRIPYMGDLGPKHINILFGYMDLFVP